YRPAIDLLKGVHTETPEAVRKGDELTHGQYLQRQTLAEIIRGAGRRTAVAGAKPIALLPDRSLRSSPEDCADIFAGATLPVALLDVITSKYGPYPKSGAAKNDWTAKAMIDPLWAKELPAFSLLWLNEPDATQHQTGPGSPESLAAIRNSDGNLARVLEALEAKGAADTTDVFVVSDHGCSTVASHQDVAALLTKAGVKATRAFKNKPTPGEVLVVSNSGSCFIYVIGHEHSVVQAIVKALQTWEFSGAIFTHREMPGTFALSQIHLDSEAPPDVVVSLKWTADKNKSGTAGTITIDGSAFNAGQGAHVSLSPFDMHATLIAAGPDFRKGFVSELPSGNVDLAPTILWLLGIKPPKPFDGRVLSEALSSEGPPTTAPELHHIEAHAGTWRQYLNYTQVNGVDYFDEGNAK
ncbi:MAG TPA: alkaline phosphatase family protein, partial [Candidatus Dormibacteraeota bacterium]|nr:alkaline phosphatase family protein [Candidatus Dormibacteraeota bacterium]